MIVFDLPLWVWLFASVIALLAGLIKGLVGFAMPMVMISGLGSFMSPELALAGLILPTLLMNAWQALRQGARAVLRAIRRYALFLSASMIVLIMSAQLVTRMPASIMLLLIGIPITIFAVSGLLGKPIRLPNKPGRKTEVSVGAVAGFFGGISGIWGPPTVAMLTAQNTPKADQMQVQGVIYGLGAIALTGAHIGSGVLRLQTLPLSAFLILPAAIGMAAGFYAHDRIDQSVFRQLTLVVLFIGGLNLIRRAVF